MVTPRKSAKVGWGRLINFVGRFSLGVHTYNSKHHARQRLQGCRRSRIVGSRCLAEVSDPDLR